jgi:RNA polymerase sigma-70 factor, ECF subfamily
VTGRRHAGPDPRQFEEWVRSTHSDIWRFCAYLVDADSADDLTQETYLRAHRAAAGFRGEASVLTWLLTIARRVCASELTQRQRSRELCLQLHERDYPVMQPDHAWRAELDALIAALPEERRAAFVLTQVIGCDYAEAATIVGCPVGTIRSRVARARDDLIRALAEPERASRLGQ